MCIPPLRSGWARVVLREPLFGSLCSIWSFILFPIAFRFCSVYSVCRQSRPQFAAGVRMEARLTVTCLSHLHSSKRKTPKGDEETGGRRLPASGLNLGLSLQMGFCTCECANAQMNAWMCTQRCFSQGESQLPAVPSGGRWHTQPCPPQKGS